MRTIAFALALAGAPAQAAPVATAAPPPPCITRAQVSDVTLFALPGILDAAAAKCRGSLPASAYLLNGGQALSRRLAAGAAAHWAGAVAVLRNFGDKKMPEGLSEDTARGLIRDVLAGEILKKTTPADCARINEAAELLAPLPPENLGRLAALFLSLASDAKKGSPTLCP
jgi:hypothetical protein